MEINPRNIFAWAFSCILIFLGYMSRAKNKALKGEYILSIYFHNPSRKEFEACVKWLIKNKFTFLNDSDIDDIANQRVSFPKGGVFLSVDDGWQSNKKNIVEIAKKYDIPVTIFVSTEPVEKGAYWWSYIPDANVQRLKELPNNERLLAVAESTNKTSLKRESLTIAQLKKISKLSQITIGGHTHTHPILPNCDDETVYNELSLSKEKLEMWIKKEVTLFAYPNGDYGEREKEILKKLNYKYGFSNRPFYLTPEHFKNAYEIPRFGFLEGASFAENVCRMVGVWQPLVRKNSRLYSLVETRIREIVKVLQENIKNKPVFRQLWRNY